MKLSSSEQICVNVIKFCRHGHIKGTRVYVFYTSLIHITKIKYNVNRQKFTAKFFCKLPKNSEH